MSNSSIWSASYHRVTGRGWSVWWLAACPGSCTASSHTPAARRWPGWWGRASHRPPSAPPPGPGPREGRGTAGRGQHGTPDREESGECEEWGPNTVSSVISTHHLAHNVPWARLGSASHALQIRKLWQKILNGKNKSSLSSKKEWIRNHNRSRVIGFVLQNTDPLLSIGSRWEARQSHTESENNNSFINIVSLVWWAFSLLTPNKVRTDKRQTFRLSRIRSLK